MRCHNHGKDGNTARMKAAGYPVGARVAAPWLEPKARPTESFADANDELCVLPESGPGRNGVLESAAGQAAKRDDLLMRVFKTELREARGPAQAAR